MNRIIAFVLAGLLPWLSLGCGKTSTTTNQVATLTIQVSAQELQKAADTCCLAGAKRIMDLYGDYVAISIAGHRGYRDHFIAMASSSDPLGGNPAEFARRSLPPHIKVASSDIVTGYTKADGSYSAKLGSRFPNTITVTAHSADGSLRARSRVVIATGDIVSFQPLIGQEPLLAPIALDARVWVRFLKTGQSPDDAVYHAGAQAQNPAAAQLQVYKREFAMKNPGQFGVIQIGDPGGTKAFKSWNRLGEVQNDTNYLLTNGIMGQHMLPVAPETPKWWDGSLALDKEFVDTLKKAEGELIIIPVFKAKHYPDASDGKYQALWDPIRDKAPTGTMGFYNIVGFVGARISEVSGNDPSNCVIAIQPASVMCESAVISKSVPAGEGHSYLDAAIPQTTFVPLKVVHLAD